MSNNEQRKFECTHFNRNQQGAIDHRNEELTTTKNNLLPIHVCAHCNKQYQSKASLRYHAYKHMTQVQFICDVNDCGKSFTNPKLLSAHKCAHHKPSPPQHICEYCGYCTRVRGNLRVHRRIHTGIKPYCCELCGKRFIALYQLHTHCATHTAERRHRCDVCDVAFSSSKTLSHHRVLHLAQKKYECECCGQRYAQAAGMSQHMRMHRERNEYKIIASKVTEEKLTACLNASTK